MVVRRRQPGHERVDRALLRSRGWRRSLLPPLAAFLAANAVLAAAAALGGFAPLAAHSWTSFDSPIYLDIAQRGYTTYPCPPAQLAQGARACGTVGWFPLYPALVAPLIAAGAAPEAAGVAVSLAAWLAMLVVLWNGLLLPARGSCRGRLAALALAAVAPGAFYFHSVYPVALAACLLTVAAVCLRRRRWLGAGVAGFLAVASYPAAAVLAGVAAIWLLAVEPAPSWAQRLRRVALVSGLSAAGFAAVLLYAQLATGAWDGYFGVQARFHHGLHVPLGDYLDIARPRTEGLGHISLFLAFQAWLTTAVVLAVVVTAWRRRREAEPFDRLLVLWALAFWLAPLTQSVVAYYRTDALLVPALAALVRAPIAAVLAFAAAGAVVAAGMTVAFMQGVLV